MPKLMNHNEWEEHFSGYDQMTEEEKKYRTQIAFEIQNK
jgi:hypothetical protein